MLIIIRVSSPPTPIHQKYKINDIKSLLFPSVNSDGLGVIKIGNITMFNVYFFWNTFCNKSYFGVWCFRVWDVLMLLLAWRLSRAQLINQRTTAQLSCQIGNNNGKRKKGHRQDQMQRWDERWDENLLYLEILILDAYHHKRGGCHVGFKLWVGCGNQSQKRVNGQFPFSSFCLILGIFP